MSTTDTNTIDKKRTKWKSVLVNALNPLLMWYTIGILIITYFTNSSLSVILSFGLFYYLSKKNILTVINVIQYIVFYSFGLFAIYFFETDIIYYLIFHSVIPLLIFYLMIVLRIKRFSFLTKFITSKVEKHKGFFSKYKAIIFLILSFLISFSLYPISNIFIGVFIISIVGTLLFGTSNYYRSSIYYLSLNILYILLFNLFFKYGIFLLIENPLAFIQMYSFTIIAPILMVYTYHQYQLKVNDEFIDDVSITEDNSLQNEEEDSILKAKKDVSLMKLHQLLINISQQKEK